MACNKYPQWKNNQGFKDEMGNIRDWFDCGDFYYDGEFNVIRLPKDLSIYHGSPALVKNNVEGPYGIEYFDEKIGLTKKERENLTDVNKTDEEKLNFLNEMYKPNVAWYGDLDIAKKYSSAPLKYQKTINTKEGKRTVSDEFLCGDKCVLAFRLIKPATFIIINDPMNLEILLRKKYLTLEEKFILIESQILGRSLTEEEENNIENNIDKFLDKNIINILKNPKKNYDYNRAYHPTLRYQSHTLKRDTMRRKGDNPYELPYGLNRAFSKIYAGFVNPRTPYINEKTGFPTGNVRFSEIVFFTTAKEYLQRDYTNKNDWQYSNDILSQELQKLLTDFSHYHTFNVGFHSGDLLQHSIWTAFYVYNMFSPDDPYHQWVQGIPKEARDYLTMAGLIHDIGKAGDDKHYFYDKPDHPQTGYDYLSGKSPYLINSSPFSIESFFNSFSTNKDPRIDSYQKSVLTLIIKYHYEFGNAMKSLPSNPSYNDYLSSASSFLNTVLVGLPSKPSFSSYDLYIRFLIAVSVADVLASQPFIPLNPDSVNSTISFYGYKLSNLPKLHRGTSAYKKFNYDTIGWNLRSVILQKLSSMFTS